MDNFKNHNSICIRYVAELIFLKRERFCAVCCKRESTSPDIDA